MSVRLEISSAKKPFTVTFITPHQRPASGGVYAIQQFATHLSTSINVNLVVQKGKPQSLPGVAIYGSKSFSEDEIPDADAIVLPADSPYGEQFSNLPESKGKRFIYFQGYGMPGNKTVVENLQSGFRVITCSRWLVDEYLRYGSRAIHVPYGIDSSLFFAVEPEDRKENMVSIFFANLISQPSRERVAALLKETTVFVCPSWEEGFDLPGLEALVCKAALATTDTKGSRDYAFNGKTALVTPPQKMDLLAKSIITLLEDSKLRHKLTDSGKHYVDSHFKEWFSASEAFGEALRSEW